MTTGVYLPVNQYKLIISCHTQRVSGIILSLFYFVIAKFSKFSGKICSDTAHQWWMLIIANRQLLLLFACFISADLLFIEWSAHQCKFSELLFGFAYLFWFSMLFAYILSCFFLCLLCGRINCEWWPEMSMLLFHFPID